MTAPFSSLRPVTAVVRQHSFDQHSLNWRKWRPITPTVRHTGSLKSFTQRRGEITEINQYKITKEVGSGSSGRVYKVKAKESNKDLAIKVIKKSIINNM